MTEPKNTAVVLLSGGLDSTTAMAQALNDGCNTIHPVSIQYGSLHQQEEMMAALEVVKHYATSLDTNFNIVALRRIALPDIFVGGGSALMDESPMPSLTYEQIRNSDGPSPTVVPFRNAILLAIATAHAIKMKASWVYAGMHGEDAHNWAYPDCTPEFVGAMANAIFVGSYMDVRLVVPFMHMSKAQVAQRAFDLKAPAFLTWSCYQPTKGMHCGKCPTCIERHDALVTAFGEDLTDYAKDFS